ncbi:MAG: hypothetical protein HZC28_11250 [Spirochaetes bacterium]|nr:hypothetical protein [Spirochaetota bacterium]
MTAREQQYTSQQSIFFRSSSELFFFTGTYKDDCFTFGIPDHYRDRIIPLFEGISPEDIMSERADVGIISAAAAITGRPADTIRITHSVDYYFTPGQGTAEDIQNDAVFTHEDAGILTGKLGDDKLLKYLIAANKYYAVYLADGKIAAFCMDNSNGCITVQAEPQYRGRGYTTLCLKKVTAMIARDRAYPEIAYPTDRKNIAACRVAEHAGYVRRSEGIWVIVKAKLELLDGEFVKTSVRIV